MPQIGEQKTFIGVDEQDLSRKIKNWRDSYPDFDLHAVTKVGKTADGRRGVVCEVIAKKVEFELN